MEHDDPEQDDEEHPEPAGVLRTENDPVRAQNGIDKAILCDPLDPEGRIGLVEGFAEQSYLSRVLGQVGYRREPDDQERNCRKNTT